jgi:hypothetical protein
MPTTYHGPPGIYRGSPVVAEWRENLQASHVMVQFERDLEYAYYVFDYIMEALSQTKTKEMLHPSDFGYQPATYFDPIKEKMESFMYTAVFNLRCICEVAAIQYIFFGDKALPLIANAFKLSAKWLGDFSGNYVTKLRGELLPMLKATDYGPVIWWDELTARLDTYIADVRSYNYVQNECPWRNDF